MTELWHFIANTDGWYMVSNLGRVESWKRVDSAGRSTVLKQSTIKGGYQVVTLYVAGKPLTRLVHILVLEAFVGPKPLGMETRHLDGNPANNVLTNLTYGTPRENAADRDTHGTDPFRPSEDRGGVLHLQCSKCQAWRPEGDFHRLSAKLRRVSILGRHSACKTCSNAAKRDWRRRKLAKA